MPTRSHPAQRCAARAGFSLTELVVTLVIMGVLSAVALPSLGGLAGARENIAATRVRGLLAFAQSWATAAGRSTWVTFDVGTECATAFVEDPANPGAAGRLTLTDPHTRAALVLQLGEAGVGFDSVNLGGSAEVEFDEEGSPKNAAGAAFVADGTVEITGGLTVRVSKGTGLVTID